MPEPPITEHQQRNWANPVTFGHQRWLLGKRNRLASRSAKEKDYHRMDGPASLLPVTVGTTMLWYISGTNTRNVWVVPRVRGGSGLEIYEEVKSA